MVTMSYVELFLKTILVILDITVLLFTLLLFSLLLAISIRDGFYCFGFIASLGFSVVAVVWSKKLDRIRARKT